MAATVARGPRIGVLTEEQEGKGRIDAERLVLDRLCDEVPSVYQTLDTRGPHLPNARVVVAVEPCRALRLGG